MDENRLKHSIAVARKMVEIAKSKNFSNEDIQNCFVIGYNHDIGYEFTKNGINHNIIGGEILKNNNFKYWREIYYHGETNIEYNSLNYKELDEFIYNNAIEIIDDKWLHIIGGAQWGGKYNKFALAMKKFGDYND